MDQVATICSVFVGKLVGKALLHVLMRWCGNFFKRLIRCWSKTNSQQEEAFDVGFEIQLKHLTFVSPYYTASSQRFVFLGDQRIWQISCFTVIIAFCLNIQGLGRSYSMSYRGSYLTLSCHKARVCTTKSKSLWGYRPYVYVMRSFFTWIVKWIQVISVF